MKNVTVMSWCIAFLYDLIVLSKIRFEQKRKLSPS